jgi:lipopolysaccharide export system permease protein
MKILTRYILKEHAGPFLLGIAGIVFLFLLNLVFRDLGKMLGKGVSFVIILKFFLLNLAWIVALAVPMAVLIATIMGFGRMASDREIDAIKASAIPIQKLVSPIFFMAILLTGLMILFNNTLLPEYNHRLRILYLNLSRAKPTLSIDPNVATNEIPNYTILVQKVHDKSNLLEGIYINDNSDFNYNKTIIASKGNLEYLKAEGRILFTLYDGEIHQVGKSDFEQYRRLQFQKESISIPLTDTDLEANAEQERGDREKSAGMIKEDIIHDQKILKEKIETVQILVRSDLGGLFPRTYFEHPVATSEITPAISRGIAGGYVQGILDRLEGECVVIRQFKRSISSLWVEVHKKYSIPFACFVFVLIGAPLGILVRQSGFGTAGWMSILLFIVYWAFLIQGEQLADRRLISPVLAMWAPNLLIGGIGLFLYRRTLKEASLFPSFLGSKRSNQAAKP